MAVSVSDSVTIKKLVAAGNDEVWYEMSAGTMTELDTSTVAGQSSGAIDTSDQLNMFEAYQKVFVVNGANLRVADFINTKLTSDAEITTYLPSRGDILSQVQNGGDIAYMVVDYISAWASSKHLIYGYAYYAGSATAFVANKDVKNTNGDTVIALANLSVPDLDSPHWYDWTPFNGASNDNAFGTLPNKAYLGCLYRGRNVLSGDPEHPFQWYMSRQANPWDFAYVANDPGSPVAGGNSDAGEIGDIIRALISYKDDYLIFGCATSMWYLSGDATVGGSLNELDLTVGIYGANSWCFDGEGNLYFWGTNGIYMTTIPGTPECISNIQLPGLIADEAADPTTHRITMAYDRIRAGLLISITKLSDGSNSNWWLDLRSKGFFPESYTDECGVYALFHYGANDTAYRDLLLGCKDGYIRKFNSALKSDNNSADAAGVGTDAISSHVTFGPIPMSDDPKFTGKLTGLNCVTAGGATDGSQSDSDNIECRVFTADSAENVIEKLSADTSPDMAKTIKAPGRQRGGSTRRKVKGVYMGIKLENTTAAETWGFEQLMIDLKNSGRLK